MRLSSLRLVIRRILIEGKVDDLQAKHPDIDVRSLSVADPSSTKKYLPWMIKQVAVGVDEEEVSRLVKAFDANAQRLSKKDINAYVNVDDLGAALAALPEKSRTKEKRSIKETGSAKVYEDADQVVIRPDTKAAVQQYGSGTKWCITQAKKSHYETYSSSNVVFYFVISKSDPGSKIAISIQRGLKNEILKTELFDATDESLSVKEASKHIKNFVKILQICKQDAVARPMGFFAKLKNGTASSAEIIDALKAGADVNARKEIANSESTPTEVLSTLARDEDEDVRMNVARNTSAPAEVLLALSKDKSVGVRMYGAGNPSAPAEVLLTLAKDKDVNVRMDVALNTSTPVEVLLTLAKDGDADVRMYVAGNTSAPAEVLLTLTKDRDAGVRQYASENLAKRKQNEGLIREFVRLCC